MERGSVVENGTHEKLLSEKGVYARLWKAQQELEHYVGKEDA
jgi:ABC-type multidrug transport system fused ATPase/permease subunit